MFSKRNLRIDAVAVIIALIVISQSGGRRCRGERRLP
jgi:hypothetical protein